jgi:hypothetical protein
MSGMERLRLGHEIWTLTRNRLTEFLRALHPEWNDAELRSSVAD